MEKLDGAEERKSVRTTEKSKRTGKATPLSAGRKTAAETVSQEEING
ncbi:hypothetical protein [Lachnoclostridium sp. Marseille-P6806]